MKIQSGALTNRNGTMRLGNAGRIAVIVMTSEDHAAMHERARSDLNKIAQAEGAEMLKTARIVVRRGRREVQEMGLRELNRSLQEIREAKDYEAVRAQAGIATGYANAMCHFGLMSEGELKDVIAVIGQAGEQTARRIEKKQKRTWCPWLRVNFGGKGK